MSTPYGDPAHAPQGDKERDDIAALAKGGRTNLFGFFLRLAARIPFLFIAGRAASYGPAALGRFASALVLIELTSMLCTMGEKRGLAQRLSETEGQVRPANVIADGSILAIIASCTAALLFWFVPGVLFPGGHYTQIDRLMVIALPPFTMTEIWLAALAYRLRVTPTVWSRAIVEPWTISIMAGAMIWLAPESGLSIAYIASIYAAAITAFIPFFREYGLPRGWKPRPGAMRKLALRSLPIALADAIEWGTRRVDIFLLGFLAPASAVGVYYAAQQVASLPQKLKTSFEPVLGPVITRNLKEKDYAAIARQVCQVGFWITASQAGIALALGIPGNGVMGLVGREFVGGTGALAFLLAAEVVAATAVVSEAALIYVARLRNLWVSIGTIALQAALTLFGILLMQRLGFNPLFQAAAAACALMLALGLSSIVKSVMLARILKEPINNWRWALVWAALPAVVMGFLAVRFLPEWAALAFGIPAILGSYFLVIWKKAFGPEDRRLFQKAKKVETPLGEQLPG
ncbi:lipopolysaccharide biosynthesis protein [Novosphingobium resinovorum]|uniref:lipopolysaccharide biosynthesis protein n=1 Tax=Novosphingobium TaxID=165696 RepID=UPI001B3C9F79|nr:MULTISPECIES: lipopolysaccharide biosynthesis protein [Novosphingobium]MBF7010313.1 lipopolysaccharide biosynthesis protein [Novosphingobium sp. HR1a]WJM28320.1 lipopolysaccharide biosynthesis protein [Novosphingobium resinovorum]